MPTLDDVAFPLATDRLKIRRATDHDVPAVSAVRARPGVSEWLTVDATDGPRLAAHLGRPERLAGMLVVEAAGTVVGDAMVRVHDAWAQAEVADLAAVTQAELGWVLDPDLHGRGIGTELVRELLRCCFEDLELHRVTAECFADNEPSWRLMERVGMRRESHSVADGLHRSGRWLDGFTYAMLADEWLTQQGRPR